MRGLPQIAFLFDLSKAIPQLCKVSDLNDRGVLGETVSKRLLFLDFAEADELVIVHVEQAIVDGELAFFMDVKVSGFEVFVADESNFFFKRQKVESANVLAHQHILNIEVELA